MTRSLQMYVKLIGQPSKLEPRKELKSRYVFFKILFVGGGTETKSKNREFEAHIN